MVSPVPDRHRKLASSWKLWKGGIRHRRRDGASLTYEVDVTVVYDAGSYDELEWSVSKATWGG